MANRAFWRALNSLAHPLTILAVVALVLNDHWLRWELPSWWTGKLGDFAWLLFAPFLCALALAWLIPHRWRFHECFVGIVSIAFIGAWFALAKTIPVVHALTVSTLDSIVGWQGGLRMDATDLLTLPALLLSWHIWQNARNTVPRIPLGYVVSALALMGTLATSCILPPPDYGVMSFCPEGDTLFAIAGPAGTDYYSSNDGGMTWSRHIILDPESRPICAGNFYSRSPVAGSFGPYEVVAGKGIYRSDRLILDLSSYKHDSYEMFHFPNQSWSMCGDTRSYSPGPLDGLYDEQTGYLLLAMSHDGILLNTGNDNWQQIAVGDYQPLIIEEPTSILTLLQSEFILAFGLLILVAMTLALPIGTLRWNETTILSISWGIWCLALALNRSGLDEIFMANVSASVGLIIGIPLAFWAVREVSYQRRSSGGNIMLVVLTLGVVMLFLLPYGLWVRRTVPNHSTASLFALLLVGGAILTAVPYFRWRFPARKKRKHPDDDEPLPPPIEHVDLYIVEDDAD